MPYSTVAPNDDPYFFDRDDLQKIADDQIINQGLAAFKEHRVMAIDQDREMLWATVEDDHSEIPVNVTIRLSDDGALVFACDCNKDKETACRHQVAALFAYADQRDTTDQLLTATDSAIKERKKRGIAEVRVESMSGEPWFGSWRASSLSTASHFPRTYRVTIRSLHRRANYCTCPDFANNQLGTCKHVEAVLHKIRKHPDYEQFHGQPAPFSYVYLAWDVEGAPKLRLHRSRTLNDELRALLDDFFDAAGFFTGRLPDDFFRFAEIVDERSDIHLGEDAADFARHLAAAAAHQLRAARIRAQVTGSGGRLPGITARLYKYQVEGVSFLAGTGRALLADDMGLGKTLQAIAAAAWLREHEGVKKILIICPASLKQQWAREIKKFTGLDSRIVQGPPPERSAHYRRDDSFFIINYELVLRDLSVISDTLRPDLIIMDEAQRIKNWRTKIAAAVKLIPSRYAFVLSGTPLENRLEDLYSLMQVVDPKILGPLWRYMIDFHVTDERGKVLGYRNLSVLRKRLAPVMLRRDRRLVRDQLPDRIVQRLDVAMSPKQVELHDAAMSNAGKLATIAKNRPLTPTEQNRLMAALQQARMACNAAGLVDKKTEGSPKLDELENLLDELCNQSGLKAVVFSQWEQMTKMVEMRLRKMGIGSVRLHGGVPSAKRGDLMDRFREDEAVQVFISTDAGGVGLNLQSASVLINLDVPWNPAVLEQRNARVHRLGQTRTVQIITMVAADSYEEQVLSLVQNKQQLFDNVIAEDASEDVVGVSKKLLETLIDDLTGREPAASLPPVGEGGEEKEIAPAAAPATGGVQGAPDTAVEDALTFCIEELQQALGPRIERIIGAKGGLLVVLDRVDGEADQLALRLSEKVPVALIDHLTLKGLQRLGAASPVAGDSHIYFEAPPEERAPQPSRLAVLATEKLQAARVLLDQQLTGSALELLLSSLLAAAADRAGAEKPVSVQEAGVWIFGEAVPRGLLNPQEAGLIMRAISLAQGATVPESLVRELADDAQGFVDALVER
ncbi:MAG: DEAD/DEAH box helicase [Thermodesulfobacteriota bacterium]